MTPRLVYIMGTGRSGSTVFEILLAHAENVFGAGELSFIVQDGFLDNQPCSCGAPTLECSVWSKVRQATGWRDSELVELAKLFRYVDHHRRVPRFLLGHEIPPAYVTAQETLVRAIGEVTGAEVIVDSSKYVARALALQQADVEMDTLRLVRSPQGLMRSWQRPNKGEQEPKSPLQMVAYYSYVGASLWAASKKTEPRLTVSYEDLVSDPRGTLSAVSQAIGIDLTTTIDAIEHKRSVPVGHIVTGNRLRKQGEIVFETRHASDRPSGRRARLAVGAMELERMLFGL